MVFCVIEPDRLVLDVQQKIGKIVAYLKSRIGKKVEPQDGVVRLQVFDYVKAVAESEVGGQGERQFPGSKKF